MTAVLYWDASGVLSLLVEDTHSADAHARLEPEGLHLLSSLAFAEVCAVIARLEREGEITQADRRTAFRSLRARPWSALHLEPDASLVAELAARYPLRGADLWHLSTASTLARELPDLILVTFDLRLAEAARDAGLAV